jgi:uncharacterized protein
MSYPARMMWLGGEVMTVPSRISLATLGVADVGRSTGFYRALGWRLSPASVPGVVSFFDTAGGRLAVFGAADLAADAGMPGGEVFGFRGVALAINVGSVDEVDAALAAAVEAGGTLVKPGQTADWGGHSGYFADPDGHLWEVAFNPGWPLGADGLPELP